MIQCKQLVYDVVVARASVMSSRPSGRVPTTPIWTWFTVLSSMHENRHKTILQPWPGVTPYCVACVCSLRGSRNLCTLVDIEISECALPVGRSLHVLMSGSGRSPHLLVSGSGRSLHLWVSGSGQHSRLASDVSDLVCWLLISVRQYKHAKTKQ